MRKHRLELGIFQREAALKRGVNEWTYNGWERRERTPAISFWPRIIDFLCYDPCAGIETLAERIKAARRRRGLSQAQVARFIGIDEGTLRRYERGEWRPTGECLTKLTLFLERPQKPSQHERVMGR